jgi:predicted membrane chloride channel (bestrophin family)
LNNSRDLGRMTVLYGDVIKASRVERILNLLCAFPLVLQEHVQGLRHSTELQNLLPLSEICDLDRVSNRPYFIITKISREVRLIEECAAFTSRERQGLQKYVDDLSASIGATERIVQTPVPLTYARHTSRFLSIFCLTAPIALVGEMGIYVTPFVSIIAWSLFGIQEIGMMIEEPFQMALKLEVFSDTVRKDLSDLLNVTDISPIPLNLSTVSLEYEDPLVCQIDVVSDLYDNKTIDKAEYDSEVLRLLQKDHTRLHGNDPFQMA